MEFANEQLGAATRGGKINNNYWTIKKNLFKDCQNQIIINNERNQIMYKAKKELMLQQVALNIVEFCAKTDLFLKEFDYLPKIIFFQY